MAIASLNVLWLIGLMIMGEQKFAPNLAITSLFAVWSIALYFLVLRAMKDAVADDAFRREKREKREAGRRRADRRARRERLARRARRRERRWHECRRKRKFHGPGDVSFAESDSFTDSFIGGTPVRPLVGTPLRSLVGTPVRPGEFDADEFSFDEMAAMSSSEPHSGISE
jgi:hypothetical protein